MRTAHHLHFRTCVCLFPQRFHTSDFMHQISCWASVIALFALVTLDSNLPPVTRRHLNHFTPRQQGQERFCSFSTLVKLSFSFCYNNLKLSKMKGMSSKGWRGYVPREVSVTNDQSLSTMWRWAEHWWPLLGMKVSPLEAQQVTCQCTKWCNDIIALFIF